jgi:hypothetical protein
MNRSRAACLFSHRMVRDLPQSVASPVSKDGATLAELPAPQIARPEPSHRYAVAQTMV